MYSEPVWYIMNRNGLSRAVLDTFFDLAVAVSVITSLYFLGFKNASGPERIFDELIRVVFVFEIGLNFFTSVYDTYDQ